MVSSLASYWVVALISALGLGIVVLVLRPSLERTYREEEVRRRAELGVMQTKLEELWQRYQKTRAIAESRAEELLEHYEEEE